MFPLVNEVRHGTKVANAIFDVGKGTKTAGKSLGLIDDTIDAGKAASKTSEKLDEIIDLGKAAERIDDIHDVAKAAKDSAEDATDVFKNTFEVPNVYDDKWDGWEDITPELMRNNSNSRTYKKNGVTVRFDKGTPNSTGFSGQDHYHILNPNATGKHDYYLDKFGNPVPKNSKASHILMQGKDKRK